MNCLGTYASIEEVQNAYPSGCAYGDYVSISGTLYYWHPLTNDWSLEYPIVEEITGDDASSDYLEPTVDEIDLNASLEAVTEETDEGTKAEDAAHNEYNLDGNLTIQNNLTIANDTRTKRLFADESHIGGLSTANTFSGKQLGVEHGKMESANIQEAFIDVLHVSGLIVEELLSLKGLSGISTELQSLLQDTFLRKDRDDVAKGNIHFKKSITIDDVARAYNGVLFGDNFEPGLFGMGGMIDDKGNAELRSLRLWEWLEVPELRYNRVSINIGLQMNTCGGGIIEMVTPDSTGLNTGYITLKLEDGEYGAVSKDDYCMGIWHDTGGGNADANSDDRKGSFGFKGFKTVYFQITEIPSTDADGNSNSDQHYFAYVLRSAAEGGNGIHPFSGMHFATRGNASDEQRQSFSYYSPVESYALALTGVNSWEFDTSNYYEIRGKLDGFSMPAVNSHGETYIKTFSGYGQVFGNAYIFGHIDQFERVAYRCYIYQSLGGFLAPGETEDVSVQILNGYGEDVTAQFTLISVTRTTGDDASDALWNAEHTSVGNPFPIAFTDLGIDGIHKIAATFNVTATDEAADVAASATLEITA